MKNKKAIYILLPIVLFIWGTVAYQFFSFSDNDTDITDASHNFAVKPLKIKERDTFTINVNYRDPFLGKMYAPNTSHTVKHHTSKKIAVPVEPVIWPQIQYKGIVSDTKDKTRIFMLIINGKTCLMKKGEIQNDVLLKDGNRLSIDVQYKKALNVIPLQK